MEKISSTYVKNKQYLLGVDTGSSKTHALISTLSGHVKGFGEAGCGNHEVVGEAGFVKALHKAVSIAVNSAGILKEEIAAMGFGFSGYDWSSEAPIMEQAIQSLNIDSPYQFVNDVTLGLIAGSSDGWGIAADAGTGNNVRGRAKTGRIGRITGSGMRFGEFGGASELVWRAMVSVTFAWSKRGPKTKLTQIFMEYAQVDSENALIEGLATEKIHLSPELAKEIIKLAEEGDGEAVKAVQFTARELALNVNAVVRQLEFQEIEFEVIMIGSVFNAGEIYTQPFKETIQQFAPYAKFVPLTVQPVAGAVLLAAENIGRNQSIRDPLIKSLEEISI